MKQKYCFQLFLVLVTITLFSFTKPAKLSSNEITNQVKFTTLEKGYYSGYSNFNKTTVLNEPQLFLLNSQSEFNAFWSKHKSNVFSSLQAPTIDFEKDSVLVLMDIVQSTGGYSIEINNLNMANNDVEVVATKIKPKRSSIVTMAFTQPYHIIKCQKSPFVFHLNLKIVED